MIAIEDLERRDYTTSQDRPKRAPLRMLSVVAAFAAPTSTTPSSVHSAAAVAATASAWTLGLVAPHARTVTSYAPAIRSLKDSTGLTWQQIADAFGVSRRAVHFWLNGGALSNRHVIRLHEIQQTVAALGADDPAATRAALLAPGPNGTSPLQDLVADAAPAADPSVGSLRDALLSSSDSTRHRGRLVGSVPLTPRAKRA